MSQPIAIVGVGLIGGSLGLALRRLGYTVLGFDSSAQVIERAVQRGAIDRGSAELSEVGQASIVFLCVPVSAIAVAAEQVQPFLAPRAILTDVGSVKAPVVRAVHALRPRPRFVGGHPMFGTEKQGIEAADAGLLGGAQYVLTPDADTDATAVEELAALAARLGMRPLQLSPEEHDRQAAAVSHLPHVLAFALASSAPHPPFDGPTFREMTRVAASPPRLWRDILSQNRPALLEAARRFQNELDALLSLQGDALEEALTRAGALRRESLSAGQDKETR